MYALEKIKHDLSAAIGRSIKTEVKLSDFVAPPQAELGDISLPCFVFAKALAKSPVEIAAEISEKLSGMKWVDKSTASGPYVNISLSAAALVAILKDIVKHGAKYGENKSGAKKRVMIEYSNANTHKEYHVGHLRNIAYGDSVSRILAANGWKVIPVSYINDFGIHVAKTIWWLYHEHNIEARKILKEGTENKGYFLGRQYAEATQRIEEHEGAKLEVGQVMQQIESRRGDMYKLWKKTRQWSIDQFATIYKELGVRFSTTFYENEFIEAGLKMVKELETKGVLKRSEGAVIADLEAYKLGVLVVLRSDGTALYPVADLPLAIKKIKGYKLDHSLYVVDVRQSLYFNQLFKILELLGYKTKLEHLTYDFVKLPSGMMSSRTGNIIPYEDLKNMALEKAKAEIIQRHNNWPTKKINQVASAVAFGALKFEMIKVGSDKSITFDMDSALRFDGFTAAYLQYAYARIQSIKRKAPLTLKRSTIDYAQLNETREKVLIIKLANFSASVSAAGEKRDPAEIAKYLFDLAQTANDYYHAVPVLKADRSTGAARLALLDSIALVIEQGLKLLGVEVVEEM
jgi:arginyl-tRNA synthetase